MLTKYLLIAIAALCAALGGTGWLLKQQIAENGKQGERITQYETQLDALAEQAKRDRDLIEKRAREGAAARAEAAKLAEALERSLSANREWADAPIPQEVQDALR
jgi:cell division protein FtsB